MKICGIIAEYNPFHNGHKYQIEELKKKTNCDAVVAIMSGNFLQRGIPASFDKFSRAKMAMELNISESTLDTMIQKLKKKIKKII